MSKKSDELNEVDRFPPFFDCSSRISLKITRQIVEQRPLRLGLPFQLMTHPGFRLGKDPPSILHKETKSLLKIPELPSLRGLRQNISN